MDPEPEYCRLLILSAPIAFATLFKTVLASGVCPIAGSAANKMANTPRRA
jgi:hypothetical protein